jgi:CRISPR-associated endonuclease Csn1
MVILGLDIGTNSVGSAWVDDEQSAIDLAVSVFPAGVEQKGEERGKPNNQTRRTSRAQRRSLARRADRKRRLKRRLREKGLWPTSDDEVKKSLAEDPWVLRKRGLDEPLTPTEFGRVLLHLAQRRGAMGLKLKPNDAAGSGDGPDSADASSGESKTRRRGAADKESGENERNNTDDRKVKEAVTKAESELERRNLRTFGELIAVVAAEKTKPLLGGDGSPRFGKHGNPSQWREPVRNRAGKFTYCADRRMIRDEFQQLWERQRSYDSPLAKILTDDFRRELDNSDLESLNRQSAEAVRDRAKDGNWPGRAAKWKDGGLLFGQRDTYWNLGTLGRCELEPTDRCVPIADRWASEFQVVEYVNSIRIQPPGDQRERSLTKDERDAVLRKLCGPLFKTKKGGGVEPKTRASVTDIRESLGYGKRRQGEDPLLNLERDDERKPNTAWFHREIVVGAIGESVWCSWSEQRREEVNRSLLRFEPETDAHEPRLRSAALSWQLAPQQIDALVDRWKARPKLDSRLRLSRRAVRNLLRYMNRETTDESGERIWPSQPNARKAFAEDPDAIDQVSGKPATPEQRVRYAVSVSDKLKHVLLTQLQGDEDAYRRLLSLRGTRKRDRHYLAKHELPLPPAPMLANPVVRKAIHEVRKHVIAHIRKHGRKPDRIVVELYREAAKPEKINNRILALIRKRNQIRERIRDEVVRPAFGDDAFRAMRRHTIEEAIDRVVLCIQQRQTCAYSVKPLDPDDARSSCGYSGQPITLRQAALGSGLERDHIIPQSRGGRKGLNNQVLCWQDANQNKGKKTPWEWSGQNPAEFKRRIAPLRFMDGYEPDDKDYFTKGDYRAKWKNLTREDVPREWRGSQATDTAYASRQVVRYLRDTLYVGDDDAEQKVFTTKGIYTAILRHDWGLSESIIDRQGELGLALDHPTQFNDDGPTRRDKKDRRHHAHHAIDALCIAFSHPSRGVLPRLAHTAQAALEKWHTHSGGREVSIGDILNAFAVVQEDGREKTGQFQRREPVGVPWGDKEQFRQRVLNAARGLLISHRPSGRKIVGELHKATSLGVLPGRDKIFTERIPIAELKPHHLHPELAESDQQAIARMQKRFEEDGRRKREAKRMAEAAIMAPDFKRELVDPEPGKGLVKKRSLRRFLRERLDGFTYEIKDRNGNVRLRTVNAADFTSKDVAAAIKAGRFVHQRGAPLPINRVLLVRTMKTPVVVKRWKYDEATGRRFRDTGRETGVADDQRSRADRAYFARSNHHVEIRSDSQGRWRGVLVTTFEAARKVRAERRDPIDRSDTGGRFVMSLAQGETVFMLPEGTNEPGYFVVCQIDSDGKGGCKYIQFKHHWDARSKGGEKEEDDDETADAGQPRTEGVREGTQQQRLKISPAQLRDLAPPGQATPIKVIVDSLGNPRRVEPAPEFEVQMDIDPRISAVVRDAIAARTQYPDRSRDRQGKKRPGSWSEIDDRLRRERLTHLKVQVSLALRRLRSTRD